MSPLKKYYSVILHIQIPSCAKLRLSHCLIKQILSDIKLLRDALLLKDIEYDLKIPLDFV